MPDETTTETQPESPEESFANLRKKAEDFEARYKAALPVLVDETIRSTGVDPASRDGLMMKELLGNNPDAEKAMELKEKFSLGEPAVEESPQRHTPTEAEQRQLTDAARTGGLETVAESQTPPSDDDKIKAAYAKLADAQDMEDRGVAARVRNQANQELTHLYSQQLVDQMRGK